MKRSLIRCLALLPFAFGFAVAHAVPLQLAHFAPGTPAVDISINGERVASALPYGEVVLVESAAQGIVVEIHDATADELLLSQRLDLAPRPAVDPMLILSNSERFPELGLMLDQGLSEYIPEPHFFLHPAPSREPGVRFSSLIHLARPAVAARSEDVAELELQKTCAQDVLDARGQIRTHTSTFGGASGFLSQITDEISASPSPRICDLRLASFQHGVLELRGVEERLDDQFNTMRYIAIGDGSAAYGYELLAVVAGNVIARASAAEPEPAPELVSTTFWWDRDRPSHGITLFEMPGAGVLYGTWSTFDLEGNPIWFLLDGAADGLPRHRDIRILATSMDPTRAPRTVGSGQLVYIDCNQAEARFVLDGEPLHSLRLQRSVPVEQCYALD